MSPTLVSTGEGFAFDLRLDRGERERLLSFLSESFCPIAESSPDHPPIRVSIHASGTPPARSSVWLPISLSESLQVHRSGSKFLIKCDSTYLLLDSGAAAARGVLTPGFWDQPLLARREFFLLAFLILLHRRRRYGLHANAVVSPTGEGVLLSGPSGSGKTTTTLACLGRGWSYLSDDAILLESGNGETEGVAALAFRRGFSAGQDLVERFPMLGAAFERASPVGGGKRLLLDADRAIGSRQVQTCRPSVLIFPQISRDGARTSIMPVAGAEALFQLVRQSPGFLAELFERDAQLETLRRLATQAPAYRLILGPDAAARPDVAVQLLSESLERTLGR